MQEELEDRVQAILRYSEHAKNTRDTIFTILGGIGAITAFKSVPVESTISAFETWYGFPFLTVTLALSGAFSQYFLCLRISNYPAEGYDILKVKIKRIRELS
jgi:hypothetical protein